VPFLLALIGAPVLILAYLFGAPASPPTSVPALSMASPGLATRYVALAAPPVVSPESSAPVSLAPAVPPREIARATPTPVERAAGRMQYVAGREVALRSEPSAKGEILDRYESGQAVEVLGRSSGWTRVRHPLTQHVGWIPAKRLRDAPTVLEAEAQPQPRPAPVAPGLSDAAIAKLLIDRSIAGYPGPCACPYQSARNGSSCGKRAAYVRPGGYAPLCYATDVTPGMIAAYRQEH
jgi:hypothetical protein